MIMRRSDLTDPLTWQPLTQREQEVLAYMADGLSNREIAERMVVALSTVKWYARQIFNKLGVDGRQEAVRRARVLGPQYAAVEQLAGTGNLPAQLSSFVGRQIEIGEIGILLKQARLVTLTGAAGSGKTRLALKVATLTADHYPDGAFYVSLAGVRDPRHVPATIAQALGVSEVPDRSLVQTLQRYLANRRMLIILDNFEHLLPAASLVPDLLSSAPLLTILVTGREPLRVSGEHEYLVRPLALPKADKRFAAADLLAVESVALFVQRARMSSHDFRLTDENAAAVAAVCRRLDGLPLAIELAAPRIKVFSPQQMLERLHSRLDLLGNGPRDLPDRQRTLRDTLDWSYNLLDGEEQQLFARLAVFNGSRTIEALQAICATGSGDSTIGRLESLVNKSLLFQREGPGGEPRFYMLETIFEYARERLADSGEQARMMDRHLAYFVQRYELAAPGYLRTGQLDLFRQTEADMDNIRAAFDWAYHSGQVESAARLLTAINYYLRYTTSRVVEGYRLARCLLPGVSHISPHYRVPFLAGASELAFQNGDLVRGRRLARRAILLARALNDKRLLAWALVLIIARDRDDPAYQSAISDGREALVLFRELNEKAGMAYALNRLGEVYRLGGEIEPAQEAYEEALALCRETGELIREHFLYGNLGLIAYARGEYEQARALLLIPLKQPELRQWAHWTITVLGDLVGPLVRLGEAQKAARILGACERLTAELGVPFHPNDQSTIARFEAELAAVLDASTFAAAVSEGHRLSYEQVVNYALGEFEWPDNEIT